MRTYHRLLLLHNWSCLPYFWGKCSPAISVCTHIQKWMSSLTRKILLILVICDLHFDLSPISEEWVISSSNIIWTSDGSTLISRIFWRGKNYLHIKHICTKSYYSQPVCLCGLTWSVMTATLLLFWSWCVMTPDSHWGLDSCLNTFTFWPFREQAPVTQKQISHTSKNYHSQHWSNRSHSNPQIPLK